MMFTAHYQSPLGEILLAADEVGLTGLWFDHAKYYAAGLAPQSTERETPPLTEAKRWLDVYFSGKMPDFMPPLHPIGRAHAAHGRALAGLQLAERLNLCHGCFPFLRRRLPPVPMVFGRVRAGAFLHRPWYYQGIH